MTSGLKLCNSLPQDVFRDNEAKEEFTHPGLVHYSRSALHPRPHRPCFSCVHRVLRLGTWTCGATSARATCVHSGPRLQRNRININAQLSSKEPTHLLVGMHCLRVLSQIIEAGKLLPAMTSKRAFAGMFPTGEQGVRNGIKGSLTTWNCRWTHLTWRARCSLREKTILHSPYPWHAKVFGGAARKRLALALALALAAAAFEDDDDDNDEPGEAQETRTAGEETSSMAGVS